MSEQINTDTQVQTENMYNFINNAFSNPMILIILLAVIIIYVILSYSLSEKTSKLSIPSTSSLGSLSSSSSASTSPSSLSSDTNILYSLIVLIVIVLVLVNGAEYFYNINILAYINNLFSSQLNLNVYKKESENKEEETHFLEQQPEVFNISENIFTYSGAKAVCAANNARLASYSEIEDAYNKGGSWCNYGWSQGQLGLFPTSKEVYDKLQQIKGHENDCGRQGVNGGYIANKNVKFGANCWGIKPKIKKSEEFLMENEPIYPITPEERIFEKKVEYWKKRLNEILISPFSPHSWLRV